MLQHALPAAPTPLKRLTVGGAAVAAASNHWLLATELPLVSTKTHRHFDAICVLLTTYRQCLVDLPALRKQDTCNQHSTSI